MSFIGLIILITIILVFFIVYYINAGWGVNKKVTLLSGYSPPLGPPADYRPVVFTYHDMKKICCEEPDSDSCVETSSSRFLCKSCSSSSCSDSGCDDSSSSDCGACNSSSSSSSCKKCSSSSSSSCNKCSSSSSSSSCNKCSSSSSSTDCGCDSSSSSDCNKCSDSSSDYCRRDRKNKCVDNRDPHYYNNNIYYRRKGVKREDACGLKNDGCFGANDPCSSPKAYFMKRDDEIIMFNGYAADLISDIVQDGSRVLGILKTDKQTILVQKGDNMTSVTSRVLVDRIIVFRGDVYVISGGKLMSRDPECFNRNCWYWNLVQGFPTDIVWIAVTGDDEYLWLQTATTGYLYDCRRRLVSQVTMPGTTIRIYGRQKKAYADIDTLTGNMLIHDCPKTFTDVGTGTFNQCNNDLIFVRQNTLAYVTGMRSLEWGVWYLIK